MFRSIFNENEREKKYFNLFSKSGDNINSLLALQLHLNVIVHVCHTIVFEKIQIDLGYSTRGARLHDL